ncbi:protein FAM221B [Orycteropus afer afer]|uniref:Protein FAM221B n=1 Tax=Orycteropus afer afer TaxID=1230840 RepID=A0A8B7AB54_ORYAF|nr:protein FAM221B [Orycteropus afer afer]
MEADKVREAPQTTKDDLEEHPSSKDPSAENLQEHRISAAPLEFSISETPLGARTSESPLKPSTSGTPLETHTSKTLRESSISKTPLELHTSGSSVVPSTSETPVSEASVEFHSSKSPEKHLSFQLSSEGPVSVSSPEDDALKEGLYSKSSYSEVPRARKSTLEAPTLEALKKHSLSGHSEQVQKDTSAGQEGEAEEDKEGEGARDSTAHTPQPSCQLSKKVYPVVPAKQAELAEVANAKHRQPPGAQVCHLFQWEKHAALSAIQTGLYIGWRCPHYLWDCFQIGEESKCFCGHLLKEHQIISDISVPCAVSQCRCLMFCFIPSRPEEVDEFWVTRRATYDPKAWRAQCRCKHNHEDHRATGSHPCRRYGCCCNCFESNFLCAACDRRWEEHETFFETEETRRRGRRPHGADNVSTCRRHL